MLSPLSNAPIRTGAGFRFVVVASRYNAKFVDSMVDLAVTTLKEAKADAVDVIRVPGAWEIPVAASVVALGENAPDAILCLGLLIQGETTHAQHIGHSVSTALMQLAMDTGIPVIHEVLTVTSEAQAIVRCLDPKTNRGIEAARTALEMVHVLADVDATEEN